MLHQVASVQKRLVAGWCEPGAPTTNGLLHEPVGSAQRYASAALSCSTSQAHLELTAREDHMLIPDSSSEPSGYKVMPRVPALSQMEQESQTAH